jgi:tRNA pseudouridine55 synthase
MHPMNGLLLVDKPTGITSHDVVHQVRRILGIRAVGHAGTLDPLASGLMVLLIGEATKVSDYLLNGNKAYRVTVKLGVRTDSLDMTGKVLTEQAADVSREAVLARLAELTGAIELDVPVHSAVKVGGKKLYEYAHKNERPEETPRRVMNFYKVEPVEIKPDEVTAEIHCSKGSFIRAWAAELGERLGTGGAVSALRRIRSEPFALEQAITLEQLQAQWDARPERHGRVLGAAWISLRDSLPSFERLYVSGHDEFLLRNGQISKLVQAQLLGFIKIGVPPPPVRVIMRESDDLLALLVAKPEEFYRIRRVFNNV